MKRSFHKLAPWLTFLVLLGIASESILCCRPHGAEHGEAGPPHVAAVVPFVLLLLCIAVLPVVNRTAHWWEDNRNRFLIACAFSIPTLLYYRLAFDRAHTVTAIEHAILADYIPFIVLLFSLYVISGGIRLTGDLPAHPWTNTAFLGVGALSASFIGTTGASMLFIRPLLQTNSERRFVRHTVVFFIFLVSNVGGCLLPVGDPPLFLGYLMGVPFFWTLRLWPYWGLTSVILLVVYFIYDSACYRKEPPERIALDETRRAPLSLRGSLNLLLLLAVVTCIAFIKPGSNLPGLGIKAFPFLRELLMLAFTGLSFLLTPRIIYQDNRFNLHPIIEVAALFLGIFMTMQPALELLRSNGPTLAPYLHSPQTFFWATGLISSFLDNAPTYVVFLETAISMTPPGTPDALSLNHHALVRADFLTAISLGAVFMGANTYIGNGPNFMVRAIAEKSGVSMPGFFGYMLYSGAILLPLFVAMSLIFF